MARQRLKTYNTGGFSRGASPVLEVVWICISGLLFESWLPGSVWRVWLLRRFGAVVGAGVVIKPRVKIKFPWRLAVGDDSWIGERVWIDNLALVECGDNVCISQDVYVCTGNHNWRDPAFTLMTSGVRIGSSAWIGARSTVLPGAIIGNGAVVAAGVTVKGYVPDDVVVSGGESRHIHAR